MKRYDTLVIGGGMSGLPLALRAASKGPTAFVERELLGGTCLNRGCIPTKTMIASARRAHDVRRAGDLGVHVTGDPRVDLGAVVDRKDSIVAGIRAGSYRAVGKRDALDLYDGHGRFTSAHGLRVGDDELEFGRVFLNTGTRDATGGIAGLEDVPYLTSRSILDLRELPEHLVVVGGGFIGVEFAQMFRRFGSRVTLVQRGPRLLPSEDPDVSAVVLGSFEADGIDVLLGTRCVEASGTAGRIRLSCEGGETTTLTATHLLVATGRIPNTDDLGLDALGVTTDGRGYIPVDDQLRTPVTDVWAMGDLRGSDMFTHAARDDADVAYTSVFKGSGASIAGRVVPHAVFVDPEVGAVGLTEAEARERGYDVAIGRQDFNSVAKAKAIGETRGFVKFVVDAGTDLVLGCHIVGPEAGNLVHEAVIAMVAGATYSDIRRALHIHPTLAEAVNGAAGGVHRPSSE